MTTLKDVLYTKPQEFVEKKLNYFSKNLSEQLVYNPSVKTFSDFLYAIGETSIERLETIFEKIMQTDTAKNLYGGKSETGVKKIKPFTQTHLQNRHILP